MKRRLCSYDMVERPDQAGIHVLIERVPGVLAEVQELGCAISLALANVPGFSAMDGVADTC